MPEPLDTNLDLSKAKTVVPLIADGQLVRLRLNSLKVDTTDKGPVTKWRWDITEPVPTSDGEQLRPGDFGASLFENVQLYSKPDSKRPTWYVEAIAKRVDGLLGTGDPENKKGKPARPAIKVDADGIAQLAPQLEGKEIVAKVGISTYEGNSRNEIKTITFPGDISAS